LWNEHWKKNSTPPGLAGSGSILRPGATATAMVHTSGVDAATMHRLMRRTSVQQVLPAQLRPGAATTPMPSG
jgi:hypothetical protein